MEADVLPKDKPKKKYLSLIVWYSDSIPLDLGSSLS
jgi:hypothetical protein